MTNIDRPDLAPPREPSSRVWAAAMAGLLGLGGGACGSDKPPVQPDPDPPDAFVAPPDAPPDGPDEPATKIISETAGEKTFAELTALCDSRGGYMEVHAACSGLNTCAGFSYGDWGEGAVLTEHSCNAVSGCNGIGCVVLPPDTGKSALDILGATLPDTEGVHQRSCNYCHAAWTEDFSSFDPTVFKVKVPPGSTRTLANWLDTPPEVQARMIAFGSHGVYAPGIAYANMAAYYKMYSRTEIERVVQYIRTQATIQIETIKLTDVSNKPVKRRLPRPPKTVNK